MTIKKALENGAVILKNAGIERPRFEAEILLSAFLEINRVYLYVHDDDLLTSAQREDFESGICRRAAHEPMAYILGRKEFMGLIFTVSPAVLIPRPDTETLVETALEKIPEDRRNFKVLDLCTGSGAIGLSIAAYRPDIHLTLTDLSESALRIAALNAEKFFPEARLLQGDLFEPVGNEKFDLLLSNPPYIPTTVIDTLEKDVQDYEPHLALDGGEDGFDLYDRILSGALDHLAPGGWLFLEAGDGQGEVLLEKMQAAGLRDCFAVKDLIGMPRCIGGQYQVMVNSEL